MKVGFGDGATLEFGAPHLFLHKVHVQQKDRTKQAVRQPLSCSALEDAIFTKGSQPWGACCRKFGTVIGESGALLRSWASPGAHLEHNPADASGEQQVREGSR